MVIGIGEVKGQCTTRKRVYASTQTPANSLLTGNVKNADKAVDGNVDNFSTLEVVLLGSASQNLKFPSNNKPGKDDPVTVKLGFGAAVLSLLGGITVQATLNGANAGPSYNETSLLGLLSGSNENELTFTPGEAYDGVKVSLSGIGILSANLYHAYFTTNVTNRTACDQPIDAVFGVGSSAGNLANLANFTANVTDLKNSIDGKDDTKSLIEIGVQALSYAQQTAIFETPSQVDDSVRIVLSMPAGLLTLNLLSAFQIQAYNGSTPVGSAIAGNSTLLNLTLLNGGATAVVKYAPVEGVWDKIQIRLTSVVGLLTSLNVHEIQRITKTKAIGSDLNNELDICAGGSISLPFTDECTTYEWYDAPINGVKLATGLTMSPTAISGTHFYYIQPVRFGCKNMPRGIVKVNIKPLPTLNSATSFSICSDLAINYTAESATPGTTFTWTRLAVNGITNAAATGSDAIISETLVNTTNTAIPVTYTFKLTADGCPKYQNVTVIVNPRATAANIISADKPLCKGESLTLSASGLGVTNPVFNWYSDELLTSPIRMNSSSVIVTPSSTTSYYVTVQGTGLCENVPTKAKKITVTVYDKPPKTQIINILIN